jgi:hypothetical protein
MSRVAITAGLDSVVEFDSVTMRMPRRRRRKGAGRRQRLRRIAGEVRREEAEGAGPAGSSSTRRGNAPAR